MKNKFLKIERNEHIVTVRINRADARNSMCVDLLQELHEAAQRLRDDQAASVVILAGAENFFSAGVDLKDPKLMEAFHAPVSVRRRLFDIGPRMCTAWEDLPQITIAAIEGYCVGGAVSLCLACDFRIMAEDSWLLIPEIGLGMNYSWGSLPRLANLVGPAIAKKWVILPEKVPCEEAARAGFAQWICKRGESPATARSVAETISARPQGAVSMTKQTVNAMMKAGQTAAHMDTDQFALTLLSDDFAEGAAAFLEKRKPVFNRGLPKE